MHILFDKTRKIILDYALLAIIIVMLIFYAFNNQVNFLSILIIAIVLFLYFGLIYREVTKIVVDKEIITIDKMFLYHRRFNYPINHIKMIKLRSSNIALVVKRIRIIDIGDNIYDFDFTCSKKEFNYIFSILSHNGIPVVQEQPFNI